MYNSIFDYVKDTSTVDSVKEKARQSIHPDIHFNKTCVMMLVTNLENPEWVTVDCDQKILSHVLCRINTENTIPPNLRPNKYNRTCLNYQNLKDVFCLLFLWTKEKGNINTKCKLLGMDNYKFKNITRLLPILLAAKMAISPILSLGYNDHTTVYQFEFNTFLQKYISTSISFNVEIYQGYQVCHTKSLKSQVGISGFTCKFGIIISSLFICDGVYDCPNADASDEEYCQCNSTEETLKHCKEINIAKSHTVCHELYYLKNGNCYQYTNMYTKKEKYSNHTEHNIQTYSCKQGSVVEKDLVNDLYPDCFQGDDEPILLQLYLHHNKKGCADANQIQCLEGHPKCYNISEICSYRLNRYGYLLPCRNGAHLENCKDFECNAKFKCPNYYCIPYEYVCDGSWDCPTGIDEELCMDQSRCQNMFKCKGSVSICIHLHNICDATKNCPLGDDELLCEVKDLFCSPNCKCLGLAISCIEGILPGTIRKLPFLFISHNHFKNFRFKPFMVRCPFVHYLRLRFNNIGTQDICTCNCNQVKSFDVAFNLLSIIKRQCFLVFSQLMFLFLNDNAIRFIEEYSFSNLYYLKLVNLSNNAITKIPNFMFENTLSVMIMSIRHNPILSIHKNTFLNMEVKFVDSTSYHICCLHHNSNCNAYKPWYISCSDLLPTNLVKSVYLIVSFLIVTVNLISMFLNVITRLSNMSYSMTAISTNVADILLGIYLNIIWMTDVSFKGQFISYDQSWKSSFICFTAFGIFLWFSILSSLTLLFLSLSRLLVVVNPVHTTLKTKNLVFKWLLVIFGVSRCLTVLFTCLEYYTQGKLTLNLCLPFADPTKSSVVIEVLVWLVGIVQFIAMLVISLSHLVLAKSLKQSQTKVKGSKYLYKSNLLMTVHLPMITMSNIICWVPTNIMYFAFLFLAKYPIELLTWAIALVTSLNSIINPVIFIVTSTKKILLAKTKKKRLKIKD